MSKYPQESYYDAWRTVSTSLIALRFSDGKNNCRRIAVKYEMLREINPWMKSSAEDPYELFENPGDVGFVSY